MLFWVVAITGSRSLLGVPGDVVLGVAGSFGGWMAGAGGAVGKWLAMSRLPAPGSLGLAAGTEPGLVPGSNGTSNFEGSSPSGGTLSWLRPSETWMSGI